MAQARALCEELVAMKEEDLRVRSELASDGSLFDGYHPRMEEVHRRNAARLREIIDEHGWPGHELVGKKGAEAAWLIAQHAIGEPPFQRRCLELLRQAVQKGDAPAWQIAYLEDRIRCFEGRAQLYGTQWETDDDGRPVPCPIDDPDRVDDRRLAVGMQPIAAVKESLPPVEPLDPERKEKREHDYQEWLRRVGWRK